MSYRLIALDMDGTLLHKGSVSAENAKWVKFALKEGYYVVLATGRPIHEARPTAERLGMNLPLVINNGSEVWKTPHTLHLRHELESQQVERLFQLIDRYRGEVDYWAHTVEGDADAGDIRERLRSVRWLQFAVRSDQPDYLREIRDEVASWNVFEISNSHITNYEFNPKGVNKASGLREVCELLGVSMAEAIAVGDSLNDIPMIREAGLGVAMGNAQEPVKQVADLIAPSNEEDGVAAVIRSHLMGVDKAHEQY